MELRRLGKYGLEVPALCLGTMTFGLQVDERESKIILDEAYDAGLVFLDTSDAYPLGGRKYSETIRFSSFLFLHGSSTARRSWCPSGGPP